MEESLSVFLARELGLPLSEHGVLGSGEVPFALAEIGQMVLENTGKFIDEEVVLETPRRIADEVLQDVLRRFYQARGLTIRGADLLSLYRGNELVGWITVTNDSGRPYGRLLVTTNKFPSA